MRIIVLTPTYNRPDNIKQLYKTLQQQSRKDFLWLIVNDGSKEDYVPVVEEIKKEADFDVEYLLKENGGKSSAVNYAFDHISDKDSFVAIIDDDEQLLPDATEKLSRYAEEYKDSTIGVIHFYRELVNTHKGLSNGKIIARPVFDRDYTMTFQAFKGKKYFADGYIGYFLKKVGDARFPLFKNEKYVGPTVLVMLVTMKYDMLWSHEVLGRTDYLEGGLSKLGRPLRMKSPLGMATRSLLMQTKESGWKLRLIQSIAYYAYLHLAGLKAVGIEIEKTYHPMCPLLAKPWGQMLCAYWKHKYKM